jgi:hypothetical protein
LMCWGLRRRVSNPPRGCNLAAVPGKRAYGLGCSNAGLLDIESQLKMAAADFAKCLILLARPTGFEPVLPP